MKAIFKRVPTPLAIVAVFCLMIGISSGTALSATATSSLGFTVSASGVTVDLGRPVQDGDDMNVRITKLDGSQEVSLNYHVEGNGQYGQKFRGQQPWVTSVRDHPNYPGWDNYCIVWVQVHGYDDHYGEDNRGRGESNLDTRGWKECTSTPPTTTPTVAEASVSVTPATCTAPATLVYGTTKHATITGTADGTTGPGSYVNDAVADEGASFAEGVVTHWEGTLDGQKPLQSTDPSADCYVPPTVKECVDAGAVTWTNNADLSEATVTLKPGFTTCDVSLNDYLTEGPTWETSGNQVPNDHDTVHLTESNPTGVLKVNTGSCYYQNDLYIGTTKFDGIDGALPHYPTSYVPTGLLASWNGGKECTEPPLPPKVCTTIEDGPVATNKDEAGWNHHDTRSTGAFNYVPGGIRLYTTDTANPASGQNKSTLYRTITPTPLADFSEPSVTFADGGTGVKPGLQVGIDVDGDGDWDGYLVGEPWAYDAAHPWHIDKPGFNVPAGAGYASAGTWADFVAANPNAKVIELGLSLGSGVLGDWTVTNITAGCISYTFDFIAPVIKPNVTISAGACYYDADQDLSFKPISVTLDNTKSNTPVEFTFSAPYGDLSRTVPGGESVTVRAQDGWQNGVGYQVTAGEQIFDVSIPAFESCEPVTIIDVPPALSVNPPTCTADGSLPPLEDGKNYTAAYDRPFEGPGTYTAVYTANKGTKFKDGSTTASQDLTVASKLTEGCSTTPPTTTPSTPTDSKTPTTPIKTSAGTLPNTGSDIAGPLTIGFLLVMLGAAVATILAVRRRTAK